MVCKVQVKISPMVKNDLDKFKNNKESYNEVIAKLILDRKLKEEEENGGG